MTFCSQVRNKPIEPPKKPEKAPFFLPSTPSLSGEILFMPNAVADGDEKDAKAQVLTCSNQKLNLSSQFSLLLHSCADNGDCKSSFYSHLLCFVLAFKEHR